jgi:uncharacterized protein (UPF0332 family)
VNVEKCIAGGLLAKAKPDLEKAQSSLDMAGHKLGLAEKELEHGIYENAVISAYASMFHSARAVLFRDGYKERSHFAIWVYLNEKYSDRIERRYLSELNSLRLERHELMYGLGKNPEVLKSEAESAIRMARGFLGAVRKMAGNGI